MPLPQIARDVRAWARTDANPLTAALQKAREEARDIIDLSGATAHENGLVPPLDRLRRLADDAVSRALRYRPDPRGQRDAREAVAAFYQRRGLATHPDQIFLTPGSSVGYLCLLRALCNAGDEVLVPQPGYPLFDDLCTFAGARQRYYHLREDGGYWRVDLEDLAFQITPRTRVVALVSPHNPLGVVLSANELAAIASLCEKHGMTLVFDEVFSEYVASPFLPRPQGGCVTVLLNGLSKMLWLPGLKVGWMRVSEGASDLLDVLEYAGDLLLPVSEIGQAMTAGLLETADGDAASFAVEIARRRDRVIEVLGHPVVPSQGGVYVCVPVDGDDDEVALRALENGVAVHPGHYYALDGHVVFTCLANEPRLVEGARRLRATLAAR